MLGNRLRILSIIITGTLVAGIGNFVSFMYFYKVMCVEYLSEDQRMVHGGQMLDEVLPFYLLLALVSVGILVLATYHFVRSGTAVKSPAKE